jgi:hypothetical protein
MEACMDNLIFSFLDTFKKVYIHNIYMQKMLRQRKKAIPLQLVVDKAKPDLVGRIMQGGYRERSFSDTEALKIAILRIHQEHLSALEYMGSDFLDSKDEAQARKNAAVLILIERNEALTAFRKGLGNEFGHIRRAAAEGISDIILSSCDDEEQEDALKLLEKAANKGITEAADEIKTRLMEFGFRVVDRLQLKDLIAISKELFLHTSNSSALKLCGITGGTIACMLGSMTVGVALYAASVGMHLYQKRTMTSE